jgi:hypothetical protein
VDFELCVVGGIGAWRLGIVAHFASPFCFGLS